MLKNVTNEYLPAATGIPAGFRFAVTLRGFRSAEHAASDGGRMSEPWRGEFAPEPERIRRVRGTETEACHANRTCVILCSQNSKTPLKVCRRMRWVQIFKYVRYCKCRIWIYQKFCIFFMISNSYTAKCYRWISSVRDRHTSRIQVRVTLRGFRCAEHAASDGGRMSEPRRGEFAPEPERNRRVRGTEITARHANGTCYILLYPSPIIMLFFCFVELPIS